MTPATTTPAPPAIEPQLDFPVVWADPAEAALFWQQDAMHFPDAIRPLEMAYAASAISRGFKAAFDAYNAPIERAEVKSVNGYYYMAMVPLIGTPEEMQARGAQAEAAVREVIARIGEIWEQEFLPEIQGHIAWWESFDGASASREALLAHLDETWERIGRIWELHSGSSCPPTWRSASSTSSTAACSRTRPRSTPTDWSRASPT